MKGLVRPLLLNNISIWLLYSSQKQYLSEIFLEYVGMFHYGFVSKNEGSVIIWFCFKFVLLYHLAELKHKWI